MEQKLVQLTQKIYEEGIAKAQEQAKQIIAAAQTEALRIKNEAQKDAEKIVTLAKKEMAELRQTTESELKLSGQQVMSGLRQQITDVIIATVIDQPVSKTLSDPTTILELVNVVVKNWKFADNEQTSLELILPESMKKELTPALETSIRKALGASLTVSFARNLTGGFQIKPQGRSYKVSLSDEDFSNLFKEFLRPKTRTLLFNE